MEVGGPRHAPAALPLGKRPGTQFIGGWVSPGESLDRGEKPRLPPGLAPRTVQPVASLYTNWTIAAHKYQLCTTVIYLLMREEEVSERYNSSPRADTCDT
jgi:hypothetical protein